jgi:hypothetical protein
VLDGNLLDEAFFGQLAQGKVDGAKSDVGPVAHVLLDDLFQFVAVQRPVAQESQDHQTGGHVRSSSLFPGYTTWYIIAWILMLVKRFW